MCVLLIDIVLLPIAEVVRVRLDCLHGLATLSAPWHLVVGSSTTPIWYIHATPTHLEIQSKVGI